MESVKENINNDAPSSGLQFLLYSISKFLKKCFNPIIQRLGEEGAIKIALICLILSNLCMSILPPRLFWSEIMTFISIIAFFPWISAFPMLKGLSSRALPPDQQSQYQSAVTSLICIAQVAGSLCNSFIFWLFVGENSTAGASGFYWPSAIYAVGTISAIICFFLTSQIIKTDMVTHIDSNGVKFLMLRDPASNTVQNTENYAVNQQQI